MMGNMTGRVKNSMKIESRDWSWVKMHRATVSSTRLRVLYHFGAQAGAADVLTRPWKHQGN